MIQEIVRDMKLHKKDIMLLWLMILLGFAVGFGMLYLIMLLDETTNEIRSEYTVEGAKNAILKSLSEGGAL